MEEGGLIMKNQRAPFAPIAPVIDDDRLERLAAEKGVGALVKRLTGLTVEKGVCAVVNPDTTPGGEGSEGLAATPTRRPPGRQKTSHRIVK
jgi:hypothetical protein